MKHSVAKKIVLVKKSSLRTFIIRAGVCLAFVASLQMWCQAEGVEYEIPKTGSFLPLKAECNGKNFYCTIDTGSFETAVNDKSPYLHGAVIMGNANDPRSITQKSKICEGLPIKVADHNLPAVPVVALPLASAEKSLGINIEAIVGVRQLKNLLLSINNSKGVFSVLENVPLELVKNWSTSHLEIDQQGASINLELGGKSRKFLLCTAMTDYLDLDAATYNELVEKKMIADWNGAISVGANVSGTILQQRGVFQTGNFMGRALKGCPVSSGKVNKIGLRWLFQYDYIIDFVNGNLLFQSRELIYPLDPWTILGMQLVFDLKTHRALIEKLGVNSILKQTGVKEGDWFISFGLLKAGEINFITLEEEVQKYLGKKLPVEIMQVEKLHPLKFGIELEGR